MGSNKKYLTIHGHFYQPPRENPWLETIEMQDSAQPFHDWNSRIACECYTPNSVSKIVDYKNQILDIVNNYSLMSFNFGPTLMSWLEKYTPYTYERIIQADVQSSYENSGHGNAIAQVYNHIIMPLANYRDKVTQVKWGIKDFQYRFGRMPEGMWLAETACDDETLEVLVDCGIKFTILSPYQAQKCRKIGSKDWIDVSWGNIDPAKPYRYFIKNNPEKYIDLFFYDGAISKSVAFDELCTDGNKFISRLKDGVSYSREYNQLVHIATDGESYGHHTKFGDMALAYILRIRAKDEGFTITNYANYLDSEPVLDEVVVKPVSSWSCAHGVGRWCDDCGCSTGGAVGWNQKWRKPLREALDYLRDEIISIFEAEAPKYFKDGWKARTAYIDVILNRNDNTVKTFFEKQCKPNLENNDKVKALKLMEIQRQALLMYTSCGWFFSELSGIETTQIMKYAARAIQLTADFSDINIEENFLNILQKAESNIKEFGNGRNIYKMFVKPSIVTTKQIASLWALLSLYQDFDKTENLYCYEVTQHAYKHVTRGTTNLVMGRIEIKSKVTYEKSDLIFTLLQHSEGDFHCAIKEYGDTAECNKIAKELIEIYLGGSITETIRYIDEHFGRDFYTLKDIFIEERRDVLNKMIKKKLARFSNIYKDVYNQGKGSIVQLRALGLEVPQEFKLAAQYVLSQSFNSLFVNSPQITDSVIQKALEINSEARYLGLQLDKEETSKFFSQEVSNRVFNFAKTLDAHKLEKALEIFKYIDTIEIKVDIAEAQNVYFKRIFSKFSSIIEKIAKENEIEANRARLLAVLRLGEYLNINTDFYKTALLKITAKSV
ncbi:MAG: DUF3536 domain-containing protein [Candidatus Gastranaerophilales bacterium]|nr:DUF3536 domain-containing protein [Candidatus Gastranaerophilales bacterium]